MKIDEKSKLQGLFESGQRKDKEQIMLYELDDLNAQKILLIAYIVSSKAQIEKLDTTENQTRQMINELRENIAKTKEIERNK